MRDPSGRRARRGGRALGEVHLVIAEVVWGNTTRRSSTPTVARPPGAGSRRPSRLALVLAHRARRRAQHAAGAMGRTRGGHAWPLSRRSCSTRAHRLDHGGESPLREPHATKFVEDDPTGFHRWSVLAHALAPTTRIGHAAASVCRSLGQTQVHPQSGTDRPSTYGDAAQTAFADSRRLSPARLASVRATQPQRSRARQQWARTVGSRCGARRRCPPVTAR